MYDSSGSRKIRNFLSSYINESQICLLVINPNQDNIFKANTVLVSNISGTNQEVLLFDNNSNVKQRINVTDKQTIKLEKEPKDSITGTVDCLGLVK